MSRVLNVFLPLLRPSLEACKPTKGSKAKSETETAIANFFIRPSHRVALAQAKRARQHSVILRTPSPPPPVGRIPGALPYPVVYWFGGRSRESPHISTDRRRAAGARWAWADSQGSHP